MASQKLLKKMGHDRDMSPSTKYKTYDHNSNRYLAYHNGYLLYKMFFGDTRISQYRQYFLTTAKQFLLLHSVPLSTMISFFQKISISFFLGCSNAHIETVFILSHRTQRRLQSVALFCDVTLGLCTKGMWSVFHQEDR